VNHLQTVVKLALERLPHYSTLKYFADRSLVVEISSDLQAEIDDWGVFTIPRRDRNNVDAGRKAASISESFSPQSKLRNHIFHNHSSCCDLWNNT